LFISLFPIRWAVGKRIKNNEKKINEENCPISINGYSTGCPPIHVNNIILARKVQNRVCEMGKKEIV
jgi:hypothetical protein